MLKPVLFLMAMLLGPVWATAAQDATSLDFDDLPTVHFPAGDMVVSAYPAFEDYAFMLYDVCEALGLEGDSCLVFPMNADLGGNAIATIVEGNRIIVYDRQLSPLIGYEGAEMVIAHELGHHSCGHLTRAPSSEDELEADAFAGAAMKLMGKTLEDALSATTILSERPSKTHPGRSNRIEAIKHGWSNPTDGRACRFK